MSTEELAVTTAIVTGASRGFGRATAIALARTGAHVVGVARGSAALAELHQELGAAFTPVVADDGAQRRRDAAGGAVPRADVGELQSELGRRRPAGIPLLPPSIGHSPQS